MRNSNSRAFTVPPLALVARCRCCIVIIPAPRHLDQPESTAANDDEESYEPYDCAHRLIASSLDGSKPLRPRGSYVTETLSP